MEPFKAAFEGGAGAGASRRGKECQEVISPGTGAGANVVSDKDTDTEATSTESLVGDENENSLPASNRCPSSCTVTVRLADRDELFPPLPLELQHVVTVERWNEFCLGGQAALKDRYRPELYAFGFVGYLCCALLLMIALCFILVLEYTGWLVIVFKAAMGACGFGFLVFFCWLVRMDTRHTRARLIKFCQEQEALFAKKDHGMSLQFVPPVQGGDGDWFARVDIHCENQSRSTCTIAEHDDVEEVA